MEVLEYMILNYAKTKSQRMALLCVILFIFVDFGCHSSSDNNGSFSDTDGDIGGIRLEVRLQGESIPAEIDRFEVSVTGPGIRLFDTNRIAVVDGPYAIGFGYLNGDGILDMVTANFFSNDVSILLGDGNGGFTTGPRIAVDASPTALELTDLNGDKVFDLVTVSFESSDETLFPIINVVSVHLNNGDGTFGGILRFDVGIEPSALAVADLNNDGYLDIATANSVSNDVSILLGNSDGTFEVGPRFAVGNGPSDLVLVDLNNDGHLDVATANSVSNDVSILLGQEGSLFLPQPPVAAGLEPMAIAVANFDDDNADSKVDDTDFPDLFTVNRRGDDVSVVLNTDFLKNIHVDKDIVLVTIEGRSTRVFQLTLPEQIPLGSNRSFFVRAFLSGSTTPSFEGHTIVQDLESNSRVIVNLRQKRD